MSLFRSKETSSVRSDSEEYRDDSVGLQTNTRATDFIRELANQPRRGQPGSQGNEMPSSSLSLRLDTTNPSEIIRYHFEKRRDVQISSRQRDAELFHEFKHAIPPLQYEDSEIDLEKRRDFDALSP